MKKKVVSIILTIVMAITSTAYAHSGRTDSNGGHKDNKNKSGLGYYHYHHGYSAHLHENGICPYDTSTTSNEVSIKDIQNKLNDLGYDCGKADGKMGEKTKTAIKKFQKDNGLEADGKAGPKTLEALGL